MYSFYLQISKDAGTVYNCRAVYSEERLHLFIEVKEQRDKDWDKLRSSVRSHLLHTLPSQYQPDDISLIPCFPVNPHGTVSCATDCVVGVVIVFVLLFVDFLHKLSCL